MRVLILCGCVHARARECVYMYVCMYVCMHVWMYVCMCVYVCVYIYVRQARPNFCIFFSFDSLKLDFRTGALLCVSSPLSLYYIYIYVYKSLSLSAYISMFPCW